MPYLKPGYCQVWRTEHEETSQSASARNNEFEALLESLKPGVTFPDKEAVTTGLKLLSDKEAVNLRTPNYEWSPRPHFLC